MGFGVFAGACTPYHAVASNFGKPCSAIVGTSGKRGRALLAGLRERAQLADLMCGITDEKPLNMSWMWPPESVTAWPLPLYATCVIFIPASWLRSSPVRWPTLATLADA